MKRSKTIASSILVATFLFAAPAHSAPAQDPQAQRQNLPEIPAVARRDAICFAYYTVHKGVLKLTAQLYPLQDGESRAVKLELKDGDGWKAIATTHVTKEPYHNYRQDRTWTAHSRVEEWNESRTVPYRVTALDGVAAYEGSIRANPVGKREIVVAAFTGNSNQDRRLKPDLIGNLKAQDPDLLFFSGDQVYDHTDHLGAWLLFGRQFGCASAWKGRSRRKATRAWRAAAGCSTATGPPTATASTRSSCAARRSKPAG